MTDCARCARWFAIKKASVLGESISPQRPKDQGAVGCRYAAE